MDTIPPRPQFLPVRDRIEALNASGLLDSPPEENFDRLTILASKVLRAPVTLVSLVDRDRQFFKSQCGLPEPFAGRRETPLSHSFCQHVVATSEPLIISDARLDPLVRENPAISDLGVIAYLGMPIMDRDGALLGALCAIDSEPRNWTGDEIEILRALAAQVTMEIALRSLASGHAAELESLRGMQVERQTFARHNAHDLRTPLNAISLSIQALSYMGDLNESQRECVALCLRNGQTLMTMIDALVDIATIEHRGHAALETDECFPHYVVARAVEQVAPTAKEKAITLTIDAPEDLPAFPGDGAKLVRVLTNLLSNALKFTPRGGRVTAAVRHESEPPDRRVIFSVADDGIGIAPADMERVFEEGGRVGQATDGPDRSTGLGLAFCKSAIAAHGGRLWLESAPGKGTVFTFSLPAR